MEPPPDGVSDVMVFRTARTGGPARAADFVDGRQDFVTGGDAPRAAGSNTPANANGLAFAAGGAAMFQDFFTCFFTEMTEGSAGFLRKHC